MRQKRLDLPFAHVRRMLLAVKQNKSTSPVHIRLFGPIAVVTGANRLPKPIEQFSSHACSVMSNPNTIEAQAAPIANENSTRTAVGKLRVKRKNAPVKSRTRTYKLLIPGETSAANLVRSRLKGTLLPQLPDPHLIHLVLSYTANGG
jgi:hypothetical protein